MLKRSYTVEVTLRMAYLTFSHTYKPTVQTIKGPIYSHSAQSLPLLACRENQGSRGLMEHKDQRDLV